MQTVPPGQPLPMPNVCFLCENSFTHEEINPKPTIDTMRDFECGIVTPLTGRKLVCGLCAEEIAKLIGYAGPKLVEELEGFIRSLTEELEGLRARLLANDNVEAAYELLKGLIESDRKQKAPAKAARVKKADDAES